MTPLAGFTVLLVFFLWPLVVTVTWALVTGIRSRQWATLGRLLVTGVVAGWAACLAWGAAWLFAYALLNVLITATVPSGIDSARVVLGVAAAAVVVLGSQRLWRFLTRTMPRDSFGFGW